MVLGIYEVHAKLYFQVIHEIEGRKIQDASLSASLERNSLSRGNDPSKGWDRVDRGDRAEL